MVTFWAVSDDDAEAVPPEPELNEEVLTTVMSKRKRCN
jgi:hypothetical protein